jgi:hypothetical protein
MNPEQPSGFNVSVGDINQYPWQTIVDSYSEQGDAH